jgi:hypothetical protein
MTESRTLPFALWALLLVGVVGNSVASFNSASIGAHLAFGAVSAVALVGLVARYLTSRR